MDKNLIIHYYLDNPSQHYLNAKLVNTNQANIIAILEAFAKELGLDVDIDILAAQEGGFKDVIRLQPKTTMDRWVAGIAAIVLTILVDLFIHFLTQDIEKDNLEKEYYKMQIEEKKKENQLTEKQAKEIEELKFKVANIENSLSDIKLKQKRSIIFQQMDANNNIVSFALEEEISTEKIKILGQVDKKDFGKFIINEPQRVVEKDEDATIEIISPVLNDSRYKWRGNYKGEVIEFSMKDKRFKSKILSENLQFGSNNILSAVLEIRKDIDEYGNEKISSYAVLEVFGTEVKDGYIEMTKIKKKKQTQMDLFDLL